MKPSVLSFPILSVVCVTLAYGFLGWKLAAIPAIWLLESWIAATVIIFILIWWGDFVGRLVSLGPRSLISIFVLSMILTASAVYSEPFTLVLVLLLTIFWSRLEMQIHGMKRVKTLSILSLLIGVSMAGGWFLGHSPMVVQMLQRPAQWLQSL
jgi:hypothetical protein